MVMLTLKSSPEWSRNFDRQMKGDKLHEVWKSVLREERQGIVDRVNIATF